MSYFDLRGFEEGMSVELLCNNPTCANEPPMRAILGKEKELHPAYLVSGRFRWQETTRRKGFILKEKVRCKKCRKEFASVVIISHGFKKKPPIYGIEAEGI